MKLNFYILLFICFLSQKPAFAVDDKLHIVADVMKGSKTEKGKTTILEGNVFAYQGDAKLYCQHAIWYHDIHETILEKKVKYDDGSKIIYADKVIYNDQVKITNAIGNVVVIDSLHKLTAKKAIYYDVDEKIIADDDVVITDDENEVILTGEHVEYLRAEQYAYITGNPILIKKDSTGKEEIKIIGLKMELLKGGDHAVVIDSVEIFHANGKAKCNKAEYMKKDNIVLLKENPVVWQKKDRLSGDEIELSFENNKLRKVRILKNAFVTSPADTINISENRLNKLSGNEITLFLENDALKQLIVTGKATSYYHIIEDDDYKGLNKIIGDNIKMQLLKGEIQTIVVNSDPGASSGIYYPPQVKITN